MNIEKRILEILEEEKRPLEIGEYIPKTKEQIKREEVWERYDNIRDSAAKKATRDKRKSKKQWPPWAYNYDENVEISNERIIRNFMDAFFG